MSYPTAVNSQITDAVTQANTKVLGEAPAMAMGSLYQTHGAATGRLLENAAAAQQNFQTINQAIVARACAHIIGSDDEVL